MRYAAAGVRDGGDERGVLPRRAFRVTCVAVLRDAGRMPQRELTVGRRFAELNGQDAYELLGVTADASPDAIKQAHRAQIRVWHSDQHHGSADFADAEAKTRLLNVARDILATRRAEYDAYLRPGE